MPQPLSATQVDDALASLPQWSMREHKLTRTFTFKSFREALPFIVRVGLEAETRDHHPEIVNVYNRVTLTLSTHDAGDRVTQKDIDLARAIDAATGSATA